jgi:anthranilate phosphoribosyltransferase
VTDPRPTWPTVLGQLTRREDLDSTTTAWALDEIMAGEATPVQLAAFAVLLRAKGETPQELVGLVSTMLARAAAVSVVGPAVDVVGTGGDRAQTVNISTMAAIVVAGTGRRVVKHGNRAASSACGAADVLEELGVVIDLPGTGVAATVEQVGIGFCFAPVFHPGLRHAGAPRRELGVPTVFNFLGPLCNPARPSASAIGCADARMAPLMAAVLAERGDSALVFRGEDGLDELTTTTTSTVWLASAGSVRQTSLDPARFAIPAVAADALRGADRVHNAQVVREVLAGGGGGIRDVVVLNAAAAVAAHDGLAGRDLDDAIAEGLEQSRAAIDSGAAERVLSHWVEVSQQVRGQQGQ